LSVEEANLVRFTVSCFTVGFETKLDVACRIISFFINFLLIRQMLRLNARFSNCFFDLFDQRLCFLFRDQECSLEVTVWVRHVSVSRIIPTIRLIEARVLGETLWRDVRDKGFLFHRVLLSEVIGRITDQRLKFIPKLLQIFFELVAFKTFHLLVKYL